MFRPLFAPLMLSSLLQGEMFGPLFAPLMFSSLLQGEMFRPLFAPLMFSSLLQGEMFRPLFAPLMFSSLLQGEMFRPLFAPLMFSSLLQGEMFRPLFAPLMFSSLLQGEMFRPLFAPLMFSSLLQGEMFGPLFAPLMFSSLLQGEMFRPLFAPLMFSSLLQREMFRPLFAPLINTQAHLRGDVSSPRCSFNVLVFLLQGEKSFFLQPGERLENGIQDVFVLSEEEGLVLRAVEAFDDVDPQFEDEEDEEEEQEQEGGGAKRRRRAGIQRRPGDRWMLRGPIEYVPPAVRAVIGHTYMLTQDEELWNKILPANVEALLASPLDPLADRSDRNRDAQQLPRDKTRVVSYRCLTTPLWQVYDYRRRKHGGVVFGPELVMLGPDEQFTVLSLSGDKPKRANVIKAVCLLLGPDFCTDVITIETADHARLQLQLAYNWHFDVKSPVSAEHAAALFSVPDFVGDACKAIASKIRGAVASVQFDDFHKNSNRIICSAVFGFDEKVHIRPSLEFAQNRLVISSVDIQSVEPVDQRTRDALQKSVQLAIEITTNSQEAAARHEAERLEQQAKGKLERQRITDQAEAERARKELLELEAMSAAVESTGAAKAEAQSRAEAARIQGEAAVEEAKLKAEAQRIEAEAELQRLAQAREQELSYKKNMDLLEVEKQQKLSQIETTKFSELVKSLGADTLREMARAGPELQVKMLQALGLKSTLITDGSSPINLFTTANGLLGALPGPGQGNE
ncbi:hypothetical protein WMY93_011147 [Mugilogobius chulae]|uniref:Major vault protein n=1 Tax=Mugilogobius chulae TaxID=88201 RepID=A0AAW0P510_9GOBI